MSVILAEGIVYDAPAEQVWVMTGHSVQARRAGSGKVAWENEAWDTALAASPSGVLVMDEGGGKLRFGVLEFEKGKKTADCGELSLPSWAPPYLDGADPNRQLTVTARWIGESVQVDWNARVTSPEAGLDGDQRASGRLVCDVRAGTFAVQDVEPAPPSGQEVKVLMGPDGPVVAITDVATGTIVERKKIWKEPVLAASVSIDQKHIVLTLKSGDGVVVETVGGKEVGRMTKPPKGAFVLGSDLLVHVDGRTVYVTRAADGGTVWQVAAAGG